MNPLNRLNSLQKNLKDAIDPTILVLGSLLAVLVTPVQPAWAQIIQVTGIDVRHLRSGVEVRLETAGKSLPFVTPSFTPNSFVLEVPNTQLHLPNQDSFQLDHPVPGILRMSITPLGQESVRIEILGVEHVPNVMLTRSHCLEGTSCPGDFVLFLAGPSMDEPEP